MPGEKQNSLQEKLDGFSAIPSGIRFDADHTWQKLETKVVARPKRRSLWLSAAAAVAVLIISVFFFSHPGTTPKTTTAVAGVPNKQTKKASVTSSTQPVTNSQKQSPVRSIQIDKPVVTIEPPAITKPSPLTAPFIENVFGLQTPPQSVDTAVAIVRTQKPKFKIAHLNELNATQPTLIPASAERMAGFKFKQKIPISLSDEAAPSDEKIFPARPKTLIASLVASTQ